jgi:ribosomal protein L35
MKTILIMIFTSLIVSLAILPRISMRMTRAQDSEAARKFAKRSARYSLPNGLKLLGFRATHIHVMTMGGSEKKRRALRKAKRLNVVCDADIIVSGEVTKEEASLTSDETNTFTVYQFAIDEVWKNKTKRPPAARIELTAPGGIVTRNGIQYAHFIESPDTIILPLVHKKYVLFLKYDEEIGDFYLFNVDGSYLIGKNDGLVGGQCLRYEIFENGLDAMLKLGEPATLTALVKEIQLATPQDCHK